MKQTNMYLTASYVFLAGIYLKLEMKWWNPYADYKKQ